MKKIFAIICFSLLTLCFWGCSQEETAVPEKVEIIDAVFASGHVILENEYQIVASVEGYLTYAKVSEGDSVQRGEALFRLSSEVEAEQMLNARNNYQDATRRLSPNSEQQAQLKLQIEQAKEQLALDQSNLKRYAKLVGSGAVAQQEYERAKTQFENSKYQVSILEKSLADLVAQLELNAKNAASQLAIQQQNLNDFALSSEISGVVLKLLKKQGELVRRGEVIATIGGGKPLAKLFVAEEDINRIEIGQEVAVALNTNQNHAEKAIITKIYPAFDELEQSFICEAQFQSLPKLYAYTRLQANVVIDKKDEALAIPSEYLLKGDSVMTQGGKMLAVNIGLRNGEWAEVLSGLQGKEVIVLKRN